MSAEAVNVIRLDERRPHTVETLWCTFCCHKDTRRVIAGLKYYACDYCGEDAAQPIQRVFPT